MALQWFKFYGGEYLYDPKMMSLTPTERSCFLTLLCLASVAEIPGEIKYITEQKLMLMSGLDMTRDEWGETVGILDKLEKLNILKQDDNELITITHFRKKQDIALTNYERVKKYRDKTKNIDNELITNDNEVKQNDNTRREENRIEKNRIEKKRDFSSFKKKLKPYFQGNEMRQTKANKKWWVIDNGQWLEFAGKESEIEWKN
jgi:hypothetical protein